MREEHISFSLPFWAWGLCWCLVVQKLLLLKQLTFPTSCPHSIWGWREISNRVSSAGFLLILVGWIVQAHSREKGYKRNLTHENFGSVYHSMKLLFCFNSSSRLDVALIHYCNSFFCWWRLMVMSLLMAVHVVALWHWHQQQNVPVLLANLLNLLLTKQLWKLLYSGNDSVLGFMRLPWMKDCKCCCWEESHGATRHVYWFLVVWFFFFPATSPYSFSLWW